MKCSFCNNTEENFLISISRQISQIEKIVVSINKKIAHLEEKTVNDEKFRIKFQQALDFVKECGLFNHENYRICMECDSVKDKGCFWCDDCIKSFKMYITIFELMKLECKKNVLEERIKILRNAGFITYEINSEEDPFGYNKNYKEFQKIISEYQIQSKLKITRVITVCPHCRLLMDKITQNDVSIVTEPIEKIVDAIYRK